MRFGKNGMLSPCYIGTYLINRRIGSVAFKLNLLDNLSLIHPFFHVCMLKKCAGDDSLFYLLRRLVQRIFCHMKKCP